MILLSGRRGTLTPEQKRSAEPGEGFSEQEKVRNRERKGEWEWQASSRHEALPLTRNSLEMGLSGEG